MEQRNDDLGDKEDLPQPGTEEPAQDEGSEGEAGEGPGNVSVDEPTAGALGDAGTPGGADEETSVTADDGDEEDDESSDDSDEGDTSGDEGSATT